MYISICTPCKKIALEIDFVTPQELSSTLVYPPAYTTPPGSPRPINPYVNDTRCCITPPCGQPTSVYVSIQFDLYVSSHSHHARHFQWAPPVLFTNQTQMRREGKYGALSSCVALDLRLTRRYACRYVSYIVYRVSHNKYVCCRQALPALAFIWFAASSFHLFHGNSHTSHISQFICIVALCIYWSFGFLSLFRFAFHNSRSFVDCKCWLWFRFCASSCWAPGMLSFYIDQNSGECGWMDGWMAGWLVGWLLDCWAGVLPLPVSPNLLCTCAYLCVRAI